MNRRRIAYILAAITARILVPVALLVVFCGCVGSLLPLPLPATQKFGIVLFSVAAFKLLEQVADVIATQEETANLAKQRPRTVEKPQDGQKPRI